MLENLEVVIQNPVSYSREKINPALSRGIRIHESVSGEAFQLLRYQLSRYNILPESDRWLFAGDPTNP